MRQYTMEPSYDAKEQIDGWWITDPDGYAIAFVPRRGDAEALISHLNKE